MTDECSLDVNIKNRSKTFLHNLWKLHDQHTVLHGLFWHFGQYELYRLNALHASIVGAILTECNILVYIFLSFFI